MPRKPEIDRPVSLHLMLPESEHGRLTLHLFSPLENRVPKGAFQRFFLERLRDFFASKRLDLAPYGFPQGFEVWGNKDMIDTLQAFLSKQVVR